MRDMCKELRHFIANCDTSEATELKKLNKNGWADLSDFIYKSNLMRCSSCHFFFCRSKSRSVDHGLAAPFDLDSLRSKVEGRFDSVERLSKGLFSNIFFGGIYACRSICNICYGLSRVLSSVIYDLANSNHCAQSTYLMLFYRIESDCFFAHYYGYVAANIIK